MTIQSVAIKRDMLAKLYLFFFAMAATPAPAPHDKVKRELTNEHYKMLQPTVCLVARICHSILEEMVVDNKPCIKHSTQMLECRELMEGHVRMLEFVEDAPRAKRPAHVKALTERIIELMQDFNEVMVLIGQPPIKI
jgi:hypothetical protein